MNLNQVTMPSLNVDLATVFYQKLGLTLIVDARPRYVRFVCPNGQSTLSVHLVDSLPTEPGATIYFENDPLDDVVASLKDQGLVFESDPEDKPWLWREAHLRDPDRNLIILYSAGENRLNPPWRI